MNEKNCSSIGTPTKMNICHADGGLSSTDSEVIAITAPVATDVIKP